MAATSGRVTAAVVGVALVLAACSSNPAGRERQACTWTIGIMGALEGDTAPYGKPKARGVRIAVDLANESGGLACTLETHSEDTGGLPDDAPPAAGRLVADEDLVACVCGYFSGETLATGGIFDEGGVAMLSTGEESRIRERGFGTWFRLVAPVDRQATATGVYIRRVMAPRRVAIVTVHLPYGYDVAEHVADALGWRVRGPIHTLSPEESGADDAVRMIRRRSADLVFFAGYAPEPWQVLDVMRDSGLKMPFVTDGGAMFTSHTSDQKILPARLSCACSDAADIEGAEGFVAEYRARFGADPDHFAADAFDGTNLVIDALRELDGSESTEEARAHVVAYLEGVEGADGIVKEYTWDDDGELMSGNDEVWMWKSTRRGGFRMLGSVAELARRD